MVIWDQFSSGYEIVVRQKVRGYKDQLSKPPFITTDLWVLHSSYEIIPARAVARAMWNERKKKKKKKKLSRITSYSFRETLDILISIGPNDFHFISSLGKGF